MQMRCLERTLLQTRHKKWCTPSSWMTTMLAPGDAISQQRWTRYATLSSLTLGKSGFHADIRSNVVRKKCFNEERHHESAGDYWMGCRGLLHGHADSSDGDCRRRG